MAEDTAERARRILGDKGDGSPVGDLSAALDEIDRLNTELTQGRAAVAAYLTGDHEALATITDEGADRG